MAFRPLVPASLLLLAALLGGCADTFSASTIAVTQEAEVADANGPVGQTGECDGDGSLSYTMSRRSGVLKILVADADGNVLYDSGPLDAAPDGFDGKTAPVEGPAGPWSVSVEREGFTGTYSVAVSC